MDIFDEMAAGLHPVPLSSSRPDQTQPSMEAQHLRYALAKQVPDMSRGFTIQTNYGDFTVPSGWAANRIQEHVARVLETEYLMCEEDRAA